MAYEEALRALADGTRRALFERLRRGPASVGGLADELPVSRPAVSQHLKVLKGAGLVREERRGTRRIYQVEPQGLVELRRYLDGLWDDVLAAFAAQTEPPPTRRNAARSRPSAPRRSR